MLKARCVSNRQYIRLEGMSAQSLVEPLSNLTIGNLYDVVLERDMIRVWDDYGEDYLYPLDMFQILG